MNKKRMIYLIAFVFILLSIMLTGEVKADVHYLTINIYSKDKEELDSLKIDVYDYDSNNEAVKLENIKNYDKFEFEDKDNNYGDTVNNSDVYFKFKPPSGYAAYPRDEIIYINLDEIERWELGDVSESLYYDTETMQCELKLNYYDILTFDSTLNVYLKRMIEKKDISLSVNYKDVNSGEIINDENNKYRVINSIDYMYYNDSVNYESYRDQFTKNSNINMDNILDRSNKDHVEKSLFKKFFIGVAPSNDMIKTNGYYIENKDVFAVFRYDYDNDAIYLASYGQETYTEYEKVISTDKENPTVLSNNDNIGSHTVWFDKENELLRVTYAVEQVPQEERKIKLQVEYKDTVENKIISSSYKIFDTLRYTYDGNFNETLTKMIENTSYQEIFTEHSSDIDNIGDVKYKHFFITIEPVYPTGYEKTTDWGKLNFVYNYDTNAVDYVTSEHNIITESTYDGREIKPFEYNYIPSSDSNDDYVGTLTVTFKTKKTQQEEIAQEETVTPQQEEIAQEETVTPPQEDKFEFKFNNSDYGAFQSLIVKYSCYAYKINDKGYLEVINGANVSEKDSTATDWTGINNGYTTFEIKNTTEEKVYVLFRGEDVNGEVKTHLALEIKKGSLNPVGVDFVTVEDSKFKLANKNVKIVVPENILNGLTKIYFSPNMYEVVDVEGNEQIQVTEDTKGIVISSEGAEQITEEGNLKGYMEKEKGEGWDFRISDTSNMDTSETYYMLCQYGAKEDELTHYLAEIKYEDKNWEMKAIYTVGWYDGYLTLEDQILNNDDGKITIPEELIDFEFEFNREDYEALENLIVRYGYYVYKNDNGYLKPIKDEESIFEKDVEVDRNDFNWGGIRKEPTKFEVKNATEDTVYVLFRGENGYEEDGYKEDGYSEVKTHLALEFKKEGEEWNTTPVAVHSVIVEDGEYKLQINEQFNFTIFTETPIEYAFYGFEDVEKPEDLYNYEKISDTSSLEGEKLIQAIYKRTNGKDIIGFWQLDDSKKVLGNVNQETGFISIENETDIIIGITNESDVIYMIIGIEELNEYALIKFEKTEDKWQISNDIQKVEWLKLGGSEDQDIWKKLEGENEITKNIVIKDNTINIDKIEIPEESTEENTEEYIIHSVASKSSTEEGTVELYEYRCENGDVVKEELTNEDKCLIYIKPTSTENVKLINNETNVVEAEYEYNTTTEKWEIIL